MGVICQAVFGVLFILIWPLTTLAATGSGAVDTFYVRPVASCPNNGDGLSYGCAASPGAAGAFSTLANIVWTATTGVDDGDTLYICGSHTTWLNVGASAAGTATSPITLDFRCPGDAGSIRNIVNMTEALTANNWTNESTNIWYLSLTTYNASYRDPRRIWIDSVEIFPARLKASLGTSEGTGAPLAQFWYDSPNSRLYLYSTANPATTISSLFESMVASGAACSYAALCLGNSANQHFEIINPNLSGGNLASLFMPGSSYNHIYGTSLNDSACHIGAYSFRGIQLTDDTASNGTGVTASFNRIHDCTIDPIQPVTFAHYNWSWDRTEAGDGIALYYGATDNSLTSNTIRNWRHTNIELVANIGTTTVSRNYIGQNTITCDTQAEYCRAFSIDGAAIDRASDNFFDGNIITGQSIRSQLNGNRNYVINNKWKGARLSSVTTRVDGTVHDLGYASQFLDMEGYAGPSQDNVIENNTFENNTLTGCVVFRNGANTKSGYRVANNQFINCGGTIVAGYEYAALIMHNHASVGNQLFQLNTFYTYGQANKVFYKTTGLTTVAGFQSACSGDTCLQNIALTGDISSNRSTATRGIAPARSQR